MKQKLKEELLHVFAAPDPMCKRDFLRELETPRMSIPMFVFSQIGYIRKWIWGLSLFIFMASVVGAVCFSGEVLWMISAMTPLLALTVVSESGRSDNYEMAELELATRFSLRSVVLARLGILGIENLVILSLLLPIGVWEQRLGILQSSVYILAPYLLTTFIGLYIVRRFRGREAVYFCMGITAGISFFALLGQDIVPQLYQQSRFGWWLVSALMLGAATAIQYFKLIGATEELR